VELKVLSVLGFEKTSQSPSDARELLL